MKAAVAPMIEAIMEEKPENLALVSEHAPMFDIASQHKFAAVVFMGGGLQSLEDFSALADKKSITLLSLPGTGGAAHLIEEEQKARGITSFIVKGAEREDPFGFDRLYRLITCMQYKAYPLPKAPKPSDWSIWSRNPSSTRASWPAACPRLIWRGRNSSPPCAAWPNASAACPESAAA